MILSVTRPPAACNITRFFLSLAACPPRRWLHRFFLSLVDILPAAPLAVSRVSFTRRRFAHRTARCIARFFFVEVLPVSLYCLLVSLIDVLPAAWLAASLVTLTSRRLARHAARCIACFFHSSTSCPTRRSLHRSFSRLSEPHCHCFVAPL